MLKIKQIKGFQGLRGWAIIMIVISHYGISGNSMVGYWGTLGVSIFFMLSGYLLIYHYEVSPIKAIPYIKAKIRKFYPLHFLTLILCIPIMRGNLITIGKKRAGFAFLCNLLMIQAWIPEQDIYFSYNGVSWYLSVTMFFVTLSPLFIIVFRKYVKDKSLRYLVSVVCLLVVFEYIWGILTNKTEKAHWLSYIFPPVRFIDFMIGGVCCLIAEQIRDTARRNNRVLGNIMIVISSVGIVGIFIFKIGFHLGIFYTAIWSIEIILLLIGISIEDGGTKLQKCLFQNKFVLWIGNLSFPIFLFHQFLNTYIQSIASILQVKNLLIIRFLAFSCTCACSLMWKSLCEKKKVI